MELIIERAIRQGKTLPDFAGTSAHAVRLGLNGLVSDPDFVRFMESLDEETLRGTSTHDFLVRDHLHREQALNEALRSRLPRLVEMGAVESTGRGHRPRAACCRTARMRRWAPRGYTAARRAWT